MNNPVITIIVRFPVKSEKHQEFQIEFCKLLEGLRQEETFIEARIHQDFDDPNIVVFYETYNESRESFLKRIPNKPWFKVFLSRLPNLLQREREVFGNERISSIP